MNARDELPAIGFLMRSGHGTHFSETLKPEHQELRFGGRLVWTPLCDHAAALAAIASARAEALESAAKACEEHGTGGFSYARAIRALASAPLSTGEAK